jgi:hypothetical protein
MLILLEGVDGGGKSSLAAAVKKHWDEGHASAAQVVHTGPPDPYDRCVHTEYELQLDEHSERVMSPNQLIILDRWHVGDVVYARYRPDKQPRFSPAGMLHCEMTLSSLGAVKVICSPPLEIVEKRVVDRGDDYIDHFDLPRIHAEYLEHGARYGYLFTSGFENDSWLLPHLLKTAASQASRARDLAAASAGTYTGALFPDVLIAGDELGGTPEAQEKRGGFTRPFTPVAKTGSSGWLMAAVHQAGFLTSAGLVNVNHPGVDVPVIAELNPRSRWVALGARASVALNGHGVTHSRVAHPQFCKRFRHSFFDEYVSDLLEAMEKTGNAT